jgi:hypothetical protein
MNWTFIPRKGFAHGNFEVSFGCGRDELRALLKPTFSTPESNSSYPDEDDFHSNDGTTFIRVRYKDKAVKDVEFLSGFLSYEGIQLHGSTNLTAVREAFEALGHTFRPTQWLGDGSDCESLGFNIASREDIGGDDDAIEWFIISHDFTK